MERNESFPAEGLHDISVRLAWAQLEIYADDVSQIQVIASGDEHTVNELRIAANGGELVIEQPQYGLSLDLTHGHWMQLCVLVPKTWDQTLRANTISGRASVRGLGGEEISIETITGDLKASQLTAGQIALRTTAGAVRGEHLMCQTFVCRTVSGDIALKDISAKAYRFTSVSGDIELETGAGFDQMEVRTVSGNCSMITDAETVHVSVRTVSGHKEVSKVDVTDNETAPSVRFIGVSGDLKITGKRQA